MWIGAAGFGMPVSIAPPPGNSEGHVKESYRMIRFCSREKNTIVA